MPAYNEEYSIVKMVLSCKKYADEVVVVDDGSNDETAALAEAQGAHVVRHEVNQGYGGAIRTCFEVARELGADKMVIIDADGQHDPGDIPRLLEPLGRGADLVIGSRFCKGGGQNIPAYRKLGMKVLDVATNTIGAIKVTDSQSGFRAYGRRAIEAMRIDGNGMSAGSEILLQIRDNNLKVEEVEIRCRYDVKDASTQDPVSHGLQVLLSLLQDMELKRPLIYFTLPGTVFASIGISMGLDFLWIYNHGGSLSFGPTLFMILLTMVGLFMVFTGIILHTISKVINRSIKRLEDSMQQRAIYESKTKERNNSNWPERYL
jgi:glycosyltransferase involved in cell wall biosynthesis